MADKLEDVGFEELAREFQQVLSNISQVGDKSLDRFREEYEKIYVALRKVSLLCLVQRHSRVIAPCRLRSRMTTNSD